MHKGVQRRFLAESVGGQTDGVILGVALSQPEVRPVLAGPGADGAAEGGAVQRDAHHALIVLVPDVAFGVHIHQIDAAAHGLGAGLSGGGGGVVVEDGVDQHAGIGLQGHVVQNDLRVGAFEQDGVALGVFDVFLDVGAQLPAVPGGVDAGGLIGLGVERGIGDQGGVPGVKQALPLLGCGSGHVHHQRVPAPGDHRAAQRAVTLFILFRGKGVGVDVAVGAHPIAGAAFQTLVAVKQAHLAGARDDHADLRAFQNTGVKIVPAVAVGIGAVAAEKGGGESVYGDEVNAAAGGRVGGETGPAVGDDGAVVVIGLALAAGEVGAVRAGDKQGVVGQILAGAGAGRHIAPGDKKAVLYHQSAAHAGAAGVGDGHALQALAVKVAVFHQKGRAPGAGDQGGTPADGFARSGAAGRVDGKGTVADAFINSPALLRGGGVGAVGFGILVPVNEADPGIVQLKAFGVGVQALVGVDFRQVGGGVKLPGVAQNGGEALREGVGVFAGAYGKEFFPGGARLKTNGGHGVRKFRQIALRRGAQRFRQAEAVVPDADERGSAHAAGGGKAGAAHKQAQDQKNTQSLCQLHVSAILS